MTADEIKQRFPRASAAFVHANLSAGDSGPAAVMESNLGDAPLAAKEVQGSTGERFLVRVTSRRKRLIDEDNLCEKYHVDLCRYAGAVPNDSPDRTQIEVAQIKCKKGEPEEITVEVWRTK